MAKLLACLKPLTTDDDTDSTTRTDRDAYPSSAVFTSHHEGRKVAYVELLRRSSEPLGLGIEGGTDRHQPAHISHLRPGGVAEKSLAMQTGDYILSINGTSTEHLMHSEVTALLENSGNVVNLEISYEATPDSDEGSEGTLKKSAVVSVIRERNSFGFTISGGSAEHRPITVSHVVVGSVAFRHGILKVGDRVLKINHCDVTKVSQLEAVTMLQSSDDTCVLEIEYDVTVHDGLSESRGPLLVEFLKPKGSRLGISLSGALHLGQPMYISKIKEAGIADRCGALHVGDQLVSVNGVTLENKTIRDAVRLLARSDLNVRLEIIPAHNLTIVPDLSQEEALSDTLSRLSDPHSSRHPGRQSQLSLSSGATSHPLLCHPEITRVQLKSDDIGFGLSLHGGVTGRRYRPIKIAVIEDGGPAALAGVLQVGDRIISLNGVRVDGVATAHQALKVVQEGGDHLDMEVEFDITDAVVHTSGTFDVKMVKTSSLNLGITINGSHKREDNVWISSLKKGGIACRMGTLKPGDVILAINGQSLENCNLREAAQALRNAGDIVTLTISKEGSEKPSTGLTPSEAIIFSVELQSNGEPLGISLTGSNHQPLPIFIARIIDGGVAHRTGALKVGDRIMAINGQSLFGKTLRDALSMLHNAGDNITLKISKLNRKKHSRPKALSPTAKLRHRHRGETGFSHRSRSKHGSPPGRYPYHGHLPRTGSFGSSSMGGIRRRLHVSSTTIASSVSGTATPDGFSACNPLPPPLFPMRYERDFEPRQLIPSDHSAFVQPPTLEDDDGGEASGGRVDPPPQLHRDVLEGGYSARDLHYSSMRMSPTQALQARQQSLLQRSTMAETDEETSHEEDVRFHPRRLSLPTHPMAHGAHGAHGRWDFKTRAIPYSKIPVGRVSPLTPSDHKQHSAMAAKFAKQKSHSELGLISNRASTGTPPLNTAASFAGDVRSQSPQKPEHISAEPAETDRKEEVEVDVEEEEEEEEEEGEQEEEGEEEEEGEGEGVGDGVGEGVGEDVEEEEGVCGGVKEEVPDERGVDLEAEQEVEGEVDNENGAKAVHTDQNEPIPLPLPTTTTQTQKPSTSTSTPTSLTRPKRVSSPTKTRTPSVPTLPAGMLAPDSVLTQLPECLGDYERTLHNARNYMREFKALAESGSSDQESDPEPLSTQLNAAAKIMEQISTAAKLPALFDRHVIHLHKDSSHADFGFSLSDGFGEPGVYVKSIHAGGLAEQNGEMQPFDRIMKMNDIMVRDYDCCRVVPILQELQDDVTLVIVRNSLAKQRTL